MSKTAQFTPSNFVDFFYVNISKQAEVSEFIRNGSDNELQILKTQLKTAVRSLGESKTPMKELIETRLTQVRQALAA